MKKKRRGNAATAVMERVNTQMKTEALGFASDVRFALERVPTGSLTIDRITGGGFPRGRHVELFGDYMAGKSYILYKTLALAQQRGEVCALVDGEKVFDAKWFRHLGGDPESLIYKRPKTAEELIKTVMLLAMSDDDNAAADVIGIDSVASLLPREEFEKDVEEGDDRTAGRARMMSRFLRRVTAVNDKTLFIWTNQYIDKIGRIPGNTTPGGRALKFYASIRIEMKRLDKKKKGRKVAVKSEFKEKPVSVGHWVAVRAEKQKTAMPEQESMFLFDYERMQIDPEQEIVTLGLQDELVTLTGKKLTYVDAGGKSWSAMDHQFRKYLRDNPDLAEELVGAIELGTEYMNEGNDGE
jgi:recombination protein RecA